jgi:hypothetical protein
LTFFSRSKLLVFLKVETFITIKNGFEVSPELLPIPWLVHAALCTLHVLVTIWLVFVTGSFGINWVILSFICKFKKK